MKVYKCDRCGVLIGKEHERWYLSAHIRRQSEDRIEDGTLLGENPYEQMDFCQQCAKEINVYIMHKKLTSSEVKAVPAERGQAEALEPKRRPFDIGKAKALRNAGWTFEKIAEEMNVCTQTVINQLRKVEANGTDG